MFKIVTPTLLVLGLLVGCAKEKSYDTKYKVPEQLPKSAFKFEKMVTTKDGTKKMVPVKYLYVPMTLGTPREVVAASPFYQGDEKVVRLEWSKEGIDVLQIEMDERFTDNELNELPVLTIPGTHVSYKCAEDDFGDCTNKEEENKELSWKDKTHFSPEYDKLVVKELNMLDAANVEGEKCISAQSTKIVDYEVSNGVINIELEKSYKLNNEWKCLWRNYSEGKFAYNSFKVKFFYSLVELDQLATANYKPFDYPIPDHGEFGYFKNERLTVNENMDSQRKETEHLLNRWAPNRKNNELVYHLSSNFLEPKNKVLLDATHKAMDVINKGLSKANSPFQIKLVEQELGKPEVSPGDLRYNTLVLIEDPLANGLLGYGPSVSNPYTGEIVQAHVNMYGGVLKSIIRRVYNAAADLTAQRARGEVKDLTGITVSAKALSNIPSSFAKVIATEKIEDASTPEAAASAAISLNQIRAMDAAGAGPSLEEGVQFDNHFSADLAKYSNEEITVLLEERKREQLNLKAEYVRQMNGDLSDLDVLEKKTLEMEIRDYGKTINHKHSPEFFPIGGTSKVVYPELFDIPFIESSKGILKQWDDLDETQKDMALKIVLEKSWIATLIHEFGHNLGLRHNFSGSTDKDNFYTLKEASDLGMEGQPAYSSIMDYSFSKYNQLKALGKYDVAALRFAYAREVQVEKESDAEGAKPKFRRLAPGQTLSQLDEVIARKGESRKVYSFCTDENAGLSSLCNRFDEGTTLEEIAKFRVKYYNDMYKYRNFRDGRLDFSAYDIGSYAGYRNRDLTTIRDIIEEYEFFHEIFGAELMTEGCSKLQTEQYPVCVRVNDYIAAVKVSGQFFIDILKTPDHLCAVANIDDPTVIVEYKKLSALYDSVKRNTDHVTTTCFDPAIKEKLLNPMPGMPKQITVGENGKFLNGFKDNNPNYKYATDRAVMGTWTDRVLAMKSLFLRRWRNRSTDSNHMALIDIPFLSDEIQNVISHYAVGEELTNPLPFTSESGAKFKVPYFIGDDYKINQVENGLGWVKKYFGMDGAGKSNLVEVAFEQIDYIGVNFGEDSSDAAFKAANIASVKVFGGYVGDTNKDPNKEYYFDKEKEVTYAANKNTPVAFLMLTTIVDEKTLKAYQLEEGENADNTDREILLDVFKTRTNPAPPEDMSKSHKVFFQVAGGMQEQLIDLADRQADIPEQTFINVFGEVNGKLMSLVYAEGKDVMEAIIAKRELIKITPRNDLEIPLFNYPLTLVVNVLNNTIDDELIKFYKNQLKRLPRYKQQGNL